MPDGHTTVGKKYCTDPLRSKKWVQCYLKAANKGIASLSNLSHLPQHLCHLAHIRSALVVWPAQRTSACNGLAMRAWCRVALSVQEAVIFTAVLPLHVLASHVHSGYLLQLRCMRMIRLMQKTSSATSWNTTGQRLQRLCFILLVAK